MTAYAGLCTCIDQVQIRHLSTVWVKVRLDDIYVSSFMWRVFIKYYFRSRNLLWHITSCRGVKSSSPRYFFSGVVWKKIDEVRLALCSRSSFEFQYNKKRVSIQFCYNETRRETKCKRTQLTPDLSVSVVPTWDFGTGNFLQYGGSDLCFLGFLRVGVSVCLCLCGTAWLVWFCLSGDVSVSLCLCVGVFVCVWVCL